MSQRHGLLIGVGQIPHIGQRAELLGPINDATAMADLLAGRFGFPPEQLRLLLDAEAKRASILDALDALVRDAGTGDQVVIHFSGHGSQVLDEEGDEPDGLDETLVPFDSRRDGSGGYTDITDDELFLRLARMDAHGVFVTLILDCCHAGHAHRWRPDVRIRGLPPALAPRSRSHRPQRGSLFQARQQRRIVLAACREDQLAGERAVSPNRHHGDWTWALLQAMHRMGSGTTVGDMFEEAASQLALSNPNQWPQLHGARERLLFGVDQLPKSQTRCAQRSGESTWTLEAGAVQGLQVGARWALASQAEDLPDSPQAHAELVEVEAFTSQLRSDIPLGSLTQVHALEVEPAYGDARLPVQWVEKSAWDPEQFHEMQRLLETSPLLRIPSEEDRRDVAPKSLRIWPDLSLHTSLGSPLPVSFGNEGPTPEKVVHRLEERARAQHGLGLKNRDPQSRLHLAGQLLQMQVQRRRASEAWQPLDFEKGFVHIAHGDLLNVRIRHHHAIGLYIYLLDIGLTDRITQIHPDEGALEYLYPGIELCLGTREGDELEVRFPETLNATEGLGFLKVFATTHPVDLRWLTEERVNPALRHAGSRLEHLLSMGRAHSYRQEREDWTTYQIALHVHREEKVQSP